MSASELTRVRCFLCGKPWRPKYTADVICWTCIIDGGRRARENDAALQAGAFTPPEHGSAEATS